MTTIGVGKGTKRSNKFEVRCFAVDKSSVEIMSQQCLLTELPVDSEKAFSPAPAIHNVYSPYVMMIL